MFWLLLACQGNKEPEECSSSSMLTYDGANFTVSDSSCSTLQLSPRIIGDGDFSVYFEEIERDIKERNKREAKKIRKELNDNLSNIQKNTSLLKLHLRHL